MALAYQTRINELQMLQEELANICDIEQVFVQSDAGTLVVLVVIPEYNKKLESEIIEVEGKIIDAFPWLDVDFDVVYRAGRDVGELVIPRGFQLFAR